MSYRSNISFSGTNITLTSKETLLQRNKLIGVDGIAYDWIHDNLYWTDNQKRTIEVLTLKERYHKTVFDKNLVYPRGIAVDPRDDQKLMYWTDWGSKPKIEKAGLDGSNRALVVATNLVWPNMVAIDYTDNRLFWTDSRLDRISSCGLNGEDVRIVLSSDAFTSHPFGIAILNDMMFWSDWSTKKVYRASKKDGRPVTELTSFRSLPRGLTIYHKLRQPIGK